MTKAKPKGISDTTLLALWRKAVLARHGGRCVACGGRYGLECNHIVKRRVRVLRYDADNGVPVCGRSACPWSEHGLSCHQWAESLEGLAFLCGYIGDATWGKLTKLQSVTLKDYLREQGISDAEWRRRVKARLIADAAESSLT